MLGQANNASPFKPVPGELTLWRKAKGHAAWSRIPEWRHPGRAVKKMSVQEAVTARRNLLFSVQELRQRAAMKFMAALSLSRNPVYTSCVDRVSGKKQMKE